MISGEGRTRQLISILMTVDLAPRLTLVLGGARSGKSRHAEALIAALPPPWLYLATAEALDKEMHQRIAEHRRRRGQNWVTLEVPLELAEALGVHNAPYGAVLIDCLTLWLSNVLLAGRDPVVERAQLLHALRGAEMPVIAVSNEVGLGIVPENALARRFRDEQGRLNAEVAAVADHVVLMAAGLPLALKGSPGTGC